MTIHSFVETFSAFLWYSTRSVDMKHYTAKTFDIPTLEGISDTQIEEHLKLYQGYVKHVNTIFDEIPKLMGNSSYAGHEMWRRFGFEFNGMRNHEYYFSALEGGPKQLSEDSALYKKIQKEHSGLESFLAGIQETSKMRGSGWVMVYVDPISDQLLIGWIDEHHLGTLSTLPVVLALDCWEHAYMVDYLPGERGTYVDAYLNAVNWNTVEQWFDAITK